MGISQSEHFKAKAKERTKQYKDNLTDFTEITLDKTCVVITLMMALVSLSNDNANKGRRLALFAALDCLLAASTAGTITPLYFALNLISSPEPKAHR